MKPTCVGFVCITKPVRSWGNWRANSIRQGKRVFTLIEMLPKRSQLPRRSLSINITLDF
ncbi:MAG: hypothetical protein V7K33_07050 [Nostoc sp.]